MRFSRPSSSSTSGAVKQVLKACSVAGVDCRKCAKWGARSR
jgi:hypothetical protein